MTDNDRVVKTTKKKGWSNYTHADGSRSHVTVPEDIGRRHSTECWSEDCDGYPCPCWCHEDAYRCPCGYVFTTVHSLDVHVAGNHMTERDPLD